MADHSRLGRGLASLMGDVGEETAPAGAGAQAAPRADREPARQSAQPAPRLHRGRAQRARRVRSASAASSSRSWCAPCTASPTTYEIIAGERRWRAAQRAGLHEVPVAVVEATDAQALEFAIIENVQRADLNAIEEAAGYLALMEEFNHSQEQVAQIVGKSRPHVANTLRLLKLSEPVKALVRAGKMSAGHARLLVGQPNALESRRDGIERGYERAPGRGRGCARRRAARRRHLRRYAEEDPRRRRGR